jgi:hypothetical protein
MGSREVPRSGHTKDPQGSTPIPPDRDDTLLAIDAYLESVDRKLAHEVFDAGKYLGRAVELAASLRDSNRLQRAKASLFAYMTASESADPPYPFWLFDDIAWEQRRVLGLSDQERSAVVTALERVLALRADQTDTAHFDPHSAQDAADRLGRWRGLGPPDEEAKARRAAVTAGHAIEAAAEQVPGLSAIALLERQAARYRNAGDEASAARVEQAIRWRAPDAKGELRHVAARFEIPKEELDRGPIKWQARLSRRDCSDSSRRILFARASLTPRCASSPAPLWMSLDNVLFVIN